MNTQADETLRVSVEADTSGFDMAMKQASDNAAQFGKTFASTIKSAILSGKSFEDVLRKLALRLASLALEQALAPLQNGLGNMFGNLFGSLFGGMGAPKLFARGGAFGTNGQIGIAGGGIVSGATPFVHAGGLGVMGERGAEAVMPLARTGDGRLGIAAQGSGAPVNVVFNVQTADAPSFRRSEGQLSAMLARAVYRGQRNL